MLVVCRMPLLTCVRMPQIYSFKEACACFLVILHIPIFSLTFAPSHKIYLVGMIFISNSHLTEIGSRSMLYVTKLNIYLANISPMMQCYFIFPLSSFSLFTIVITCHDGSAEELVLYNSFMAILPLNNRKG